MLFRRMIAGSLFLIVLLYGTAFGNDIPKNPEAMLEYKGSTQLGLADYDTVLFNDNGNIQYYFPLPDEFDDHLFNARFTAPDCCRIISAELRFIRIDGDSTTLPDIYVYADSSTGLYPTFDLEDFLTPDSVLRVVELSGSEINLDPDPTVVEFGGDNLIFQAGFSFHIGWEPAWQTDTVIAILADDGIPETNRSVEWWGTQEWGTLQANWGLGVNFMIRTLVEVFEDTTYVWLDPDVIPADFALHSPYPNPFNPETTLVLELQRPQHVDLQVFDVQGRLMETILSEALPAGRLTVHWEPVNLSSGTYLVKMRTEDNVITTRATLLK